VRSRVTAALVAVLASLTWLAGPALAASPLHLTSEITDQSGALGDQRASVQAAINTLYARDRIKLYVVYVPTFSGMSATSWVDQTAAMNGLGSRDILLGVATGARNYAVSADPNIGLSTTQLDKVNAIAVEPALRKSDWAAAAVGAAQGYGAEVAGRPVVAPSLSAGVTHRTAPAPAPAPAGGLSGGDEAAIIVGGLVLLLGLAFVVTRRMSRRRGDEPARLGQGPPAGPSTAELEARASKALVDTDDSIRTSEQELGFARARFGEQAARPFSAALKSARQELADGFKLRQLLDDDIPETEGTRRQYLNQISTHCAEASQLLDEQSEAFDRLQDLEARAPELAGEVLTHTTQQAARVEHSRQMITKLEAKYTAQSVTLVAGNPDQATERLQFATASLTDARDALAATQRGKAAVYLQAAESAADQASELLDSVEHLEAELTQAASALPAALREIDADIAEGSVLLASRPDDERASLVARARAVADDTRGQLASGPFDALAALRSLEQADAALDQAMASAREDRARQDRARAVLDQAMLVARSSVTAAEDFINTRRGGVGAQARTRLAEAQRHYQQAIGYAQPDPEAAVNEAQHADALAQEARSRAEQDVGHFDYYDEPGPAVSAGGFGGGFGGAILGGIVIDSLLGGFGGGGISRGGFGLGGFGPGSFGGIGTRGRHSIGGRF
jgi:hypothetical protein